MNDYMNPATLIDGYKCDHRRQYKPGVTRVYSNWTPRTSRIPEHRKVVYFGGQYFRQRYLVEAFRPWFADSADSVCERYARRMNGYLGPNDMGTEHIRALHKLGYIPLKISALPEGSLVPLRVPMTVVENTHDEFGWMTNYIESIMSNVMWMPCTSATTALGYRKTLTAAAKETGSDPAFVDWQGHDFSFRGLPGPEAAALSGAAHLLYFTGTDTIPALDLIEEYYGAPEGYLIGGSVAATEHSVMCAGGEECEMDTFTRLLDLYPSGVLSVVSDTWDLWNVITSILPQLKDRIMARAGKLVIRPDSGDPADIICGDPLAPEGSPASKGVVQLLWDIFGGTLTTTGHRLLDSHIGCIYGDSITNERARQITMRLSSSGFASANVVLGIGSFTYQYVTRDTYGFAMKATWVEINGAGKAIYKTPKTDNGGKNSARGRLAVFADPDGDLHLIEQATKEEEANSLLRPVSANGQTLVHEDYPTIRARAREAI